MMCIFHLTLTFFWNFTDAPMDTTGPFNAFKLFLILMAVGTMALFAVSYLRQKRQGQEQEVQPVGLEA